MKNKNKKVVVYVCLLILCISVGQAALSTTLNITGESSIKSAKWDIHFDNLVTEITIRNPNGNYSSMFLNAALGDGAKVILNYTNDTLSIVDNIISNSKQASNANIVKGKLVVQLVCICGTYFFSCYSILNMLDYKKLGGTYVTS